MDDKKLNIEGSDSLLRGSATCIVRPKRGRPRRVEPWPWDVLGLKRTTYYRLKKQGKLPS